MKSSILSLGILAAVFMSVPALAQQPAPPAAPTPAAPAPAPAASAPTTVWDGVYTEAQATRGANTFMSECSACHGDSPFVQRFDNQPLSEAFTFISTNMPEGAPGTLGARSYSDILAYLLQHSGFPAGTTDLPTSADAMSGITLNFTK